ncbi:winged helix-turn-helix domain-containing protein [Enterobacteriaceae bacterium H18W14]|uniref:winged helix-turn-helix domain-containing protein n=1 Tax=Dryocola boscaweniae TaxID=2925397 RepID=UPI0022F0D6D5|nr:winged helix-turn-helix domain-containing protein [Dryocola boscaweniae]MCT4716320.1 winged helix-turn-helix domain-containing protein [Dryocola boscaweniae]
MTNREWFLINDQVCFYPDEQIVCSLQGNKKIPLTRIVNKMLYYFCKNCRHIIKYDEMMLFIWGEKHRQIRYGSLYQALLVLRKSLEELNISSALIKTVRKKGLIFDCVVVEQKSDPKSTDNVSASETSAQSSEPLTNKPIARRPLFYLGLILLTALFSALFYYHSTRSVFDNYTVGERLSGGCMVHYNSDAHDANHHKKFMNSHSELCKPGAMLYITTYITTNAVSVVQCDNAWLREKHIGNCLVHYFPEGK